MRTKSIFAATIVLSVSAIAIGCASEEPGDRDVDSLAQHADTNIKCDDVTEKDILIADLVKHSVVADYPLTRLYEDAGGDITGPAMPDLVAGAVELVNMHANARASVAQALVKVSGEPDYGHVEISTDPPIPECEVVPTPWGSTAATESYLVIGAGTADGSWKTSYKEFGKQCPLVKFHAANDMIDPPGDGSTNLPPSRTVSATGVVANAWGLCPAGTPEGTHCKLSYATGINWTGRRCTNYWGALRCLVE
jgi:hypothetical protein